MTEKKIPRFDRHQRAQHILMMVSFIACGFTGWPLKTAATGASKVVADLLGGIAACQAIHRMAAIVMFVSSVYHLGYLAVAFAKRRLDFQMVPGPSDVVHAVHNVLYMLGLRKEVPQFGRFTYFEKFDYWAVFWGMAIMGGTGLVLWFPVGAAGLLPGWAIQIAHVIHSDEALLALLAIFVWHMYNVHLRPGIWPMSYVWLDGTIDEEEMKRYHAAEYARMFPADPPREKAE